MAFETGTTKNPIDVKSHGGIFDRLILTPHMLGGTIASYWLDSRAIEAGDVQGPFSFFLEWAENPADDFIEVAGPSADNILIDDEQRRWSKLPHSVYRIRLEAANGTFYSDVNPATGEFNRHDWLLAKEIIRREYLRLQKYVGTRGFYLGRMQWGEICTECVDYNTGLVNKADCETCYGTGFVGGYYPPVTLWVGEERTAVRSQRQDGVGLTNNQTQLARIVAFPFLTAHDVWVNPDTGERWVIQAKQEVATLRGKPLVWNVQLNLEQPGSIIYKIPLTGGSSSSM